MRRRAYVSMLAAILAGCSERGGDGGGTANGSELTTTAPEATQTATEASTEADTPTSTSTPSDPLERLEAALTEALDRYVPQGTSFESVNGSHTEVSKDDVMEPLERAEAAIEALEASPPSGEDEQRFEKLTGVFWFLRWVAECHGHFVTAWEEMRDAWADMLADEATGSSLNPVDDAINDAEVALNNLLQDSDPEDVTAFPPLLESDYTDKRKQISSEIDAFRSMTNELEKFRQALNDAKRGMTRYDNGDYDAAAIHFDNAETSFGALADSFWTSRWTTTFSETVDEANCVASAMESGCDRMIDVSESAADGNESDPDSAKQTARSRFESCDIVAQDVVIVDEFYS